MKKLTALFFAALAAALLVLAGCASARQEGGGAGAVSGAGALSPASAVINPAALDALLSGAASEVQRWGEGADQRDVTVYSLDPAIRLDALMQAVKDAGFHQVWSGSFTRDWDLQNGVLRWCVPSDPERWDSVIQVSAVRETTVHQYGFKPAPDFYWTAVEDFPLDGAGAIAYGNGKFVAGGDGRMAYSEDGVTWTEVRDSTFGNNSIHSIAYGNGKFVAGGRNGRMAYSADGVTWTEVRNSAFVSNHFVCAIAYGGGRFVASAYGAMGSGIPIRMAYSSDGITWTAVNAPRYDIRSLIYADGKFVAASVDGKILHSADGVTWTEVYEFNDGEPAIAYGGGRFVVVGRTYRGDGENHIFTSNIAYSADGIRWTVVRDHPFGNAALTSIAYGGGKFVTGAAWDSPSAYSSDGVTWTLVDSNFSGDVGHDAIAYGNGRFVAAVGWGIKYSNKLE